MTRYANEDERLDGAIYPAKDKQGNQPAMTGVLEFSRAMLKSMVSQMRRGTVPVRIRLAVWDEQKGKNPPHNPYRFVKMELLFPRGDEGTPEASPETELEPKAEPKAETEGEGEPAAAAEGATAEGELPW